MTAVSENSLQRDEPGRKSAMEVMEIAAFLLENSYF